MGYARYWEPSWLDISRVELKLDRPPHQSPLRLLHLSDLHAGQYVSLGYIAKAIRAGLDLAPDLICVTGDFVTGQYDQLDRYAELLSALPKQAPTFACLGNHDGGDWSANHGGYSTMREVAGLLKSSRVELLDNTTRSLTLRDWHLQLTGTSDLWADDAEPRQAFAHAEPSPDSVKILLAHNPDTKGRVHSCAWDLMLSGHTHGGQFRIPFLGPPFAPVRDKRFIHGLHRWENRWLHITKGVGNLYGVRFNCRPEISLLTLI